MRILELLLILLPVIVRGDISVKKTNTEYLHNPLATAVEKPRHFWQLAATKNESNVLQTAWQIISAEDRESLNKLQKIVGNSTSSQQGSGMSGFLWNSGKTIGDSFFTLYDGKKVNSLKACHWTVRVWTSSNGSQSSVSAWSEPSFWERGPPSDWFNAEWITHPLWQWSSNWHKPLPLIAADIDNINGPIKWARLYYTATGMCNLVINGVQRNESLLDPGYSVYTKRRIYVTADLTNLLRAGQNTIGFWVGNGIANMQSDDTGRAVKGTLQAGTPSIKALLVVLTATGKVIVPSSTSWFTALGPVILSNWWGGEQYDARMEIDEWAGSQRTQFSPDRRNWHKAVVSNLLPAQSLTPRLIPPMVFKEIFEANSVSRIKGTDDWLFDVGTNSQALLGLRVNLPSGTVIRLYPSEVGVWGPEPQADDGIWMTYVTKGSGEEIYMPKTVYQGFRWVKVSGLPSDQTPPLRTIFAQSFRTNVNSAGNFTTSDPLTNGIWKIVDRSMQSNLASVLTDCPTREKLGWLEQAHLSLPIFMSHYDLSHMMTKMMVDMADSQHKNGDIPTTSPEFLIFPGAFESDVNWGNAFVEGALQVYKRYGDKQILAQYYINMQEYHSFIISSSPGYIHPGQLGDWAAILPVNGSLVATWGVYRATVAMKEIASVLGRHQDSEDYENQAVDIARQFHKTFYDTTLEVYAENTPACSIIALHMNAAPQEIRPIIIQNLLNSLQLHDNSFYFGEVSLSAVAQVLSGIGHDDLLWKMLTKTTIPSFGYYVINGATSMGEGWSNWQDKTSSQNHWMMASPLRWYVERLAGIQMYQIESAYQHFSVQPYYAEGLDMVSMQLDTMYGTINSTWKRLNNSIELYVEVPVGTKASIHTLSEITAVGSGKYKFVTAV